MLDRSRPARMAVAFLDWWVQPSGSASVTPTPHCLHQNVCSRGARPTLGIVLVRRMHSPQLGQIGALGSKFMPCRLSGLTNRDGDPHHNQQSKAVGGRFLAPILAAFIFVR